MQKIFKDDHQYLFFDELSHGINLFIGAGFSILPDNTGESLPNAKDFSKELCDKFNVDEIFSDDLYEASEMVPIFEYQAFLRKRFTIDANNINNNYYLLDKLNIKSIITTNIDNIIPAIYSNNNPKHYINDRNLYGAVRKAENGIDYVALNGNVCVEDSHLYFGKFELSLVEQKNSDLFKIAFSLLTERPVLFWGYSFVDNGVIKIVKKLLNSNKHSNIWVQCLPTDIKQIKLFESLGCKVITADTKQLFQCIKDDFLTFSKVDSENKNISLSKKFKQFKVPLQYENETNEKDDYYRLGNTCWYSIYNNHPYETNLVDEIWTLHLMHKNVVILGSSFSGKTTALMQCAVKRNNDAVFYFYGDETPEEIKNFLNAVNGDKIIVFLQDCAKDINSFCCFALAPNVKLIATADNNMFESVKHIIIKKGIHYHTKDVGNIDKTTALQIYNHIPPNIVRTPFSYKEYKDEEYSFIELHGRNVKDFASYSSILKILKGICKFEDNIPCNEIQLIALTVYLEIHGSCMSTDLFFSYFKFNDYINQITPLCDKVRGLLRNTTNINLDQDYFSIRSKFFLKYAEDAFLNDSDLKQVYRHMISKFVYDVPKCNVYRYDIFKRKAYDSKLFFNLFSDNQDNKNQDNKIEDFQNKALKLYDILYEYDNSPYSLQQKALCLSLFHRSKEAFAIIDTALSFYPKNFSMKNSKAEIIYNANKSFKSEQAEEQLHKAITILEECKKNDKRQNYHAILYARIVLHLNDKYSSERNFLLVDAALEWLLSINTPSDKTILRLIENLKTLKV